MADRIEQPTVGQLAELGGRDVLIGRKRGRILTGTVVAGCPLGDPPAIFLVRSTYRPAAPMRVPASNVAWVEVL